MQLAAKIQQLLESSNIVQVKDLLQYFDQNQTKQALIGFGSKHPEQIICSFRGNNKKTNALVCGTLSMKDILNLSQSSDIDIHQIMPCAAISRNIQCADYLKQRSQNLPQKVGTIMPRKRRAKQLQKKASKFEIKKKQSQKSTNNVNDKQKQIKSVPKKREEVKEKITKKQLVKQQQMAIKKLEENEKIIKKLEEKEKIIKKIETESQNEDKVLQEFNIEAPIKTSSQTKPEDIFTKLESKIEEIKNQDNDAEDDCQLMMYEQLIKKNNGKVGQQVQNKNTNIMEKVAKSTKMAAPLGKEEQGLKKASDVNQKQKATNKEKKGNQTRIDTWFGKKSS